MAEDVRFFQMGGICEAQLADCPSSTVVGTYEMAMAIVAMGGSSGPARIDAKFSSGEWVHPSGGNAAIAGLSGLPGTQGQSASVDLATGDVAAVAVSVRMPVVCGCLIPKTTVDSGATPATTAASGGPNCDGTIGVSTCIE